MNNREDLIRSLQAEFNKGSLTIDKLDPSNYIADTGSLDCSIEAISSEDLEKTINVIKMHEAKFASEALKNKEAMQYVRHLKNARKSIEKIISLRTQGIL